MDLWNKGINPIPLKPNQKIPAVNWELYQEERFPIESILKHYKNNNYAVICGKVSENLVVIDFDLPDKWKKENNILTKEETDLLYDNIVSIDPDILCNTYTVRTASGSLHFYFKLESMDIYKSLEQNKGLNCVLKLERVDIEHVDIQGEGKYVVVPPSSIDEKYYEVYNDKPILKITDQDFIDFLSVWTEKEDSKGQFKYNKKLDDKIENLRTPFQAIALGEINIEEYGVKHKQTGGAEFSYWDAFIRECIANELDDDEIHLILKTTQPNYDYKDTVGQIKWTKKKGNLPLTNEKLKEVFPEKKYHIKKKIDEKERNQLYDQYYAEIRKSATYTAKGGLKCETKAFQQWYNEKQKENLRNKLKDDIIMVLKELDIDIDKNELSPKDLRHVFEKISLNSLDMREYIFLFFFKKKGLSKTNIKEILLPEASVLAKKFLKHHYIFLNNNTLFKYENGVYKHEFTITLKNLINTYILDIAKYLKLLEIIGDNIIKQRINRMVEIIEANIKIENKKINKENILNLKNGILNLDDLKNKAFKNLVLNPHSYKYFSTIQLDTDFDQKQKSKIIKPFIIDALGIDDYNILMEIFGNALLGKPYLYKIILLLSGQSGTGKSAIFDVFIYIIGMYHVSGEDLYALMKDQFSTAELWNKLANIHGDLPTRTIKNVSIINRLTEEYLSINKKYGGKGIIINTASHFFATNKAPPIEDEERNDAWRRIYPIEMKNKPIPEENRIVNWVRKIFDEHPTEKSGMLNEILLGLKRVLINGKFSGKSIAERKEQYITLSRPLKTFIDNYIDLENNENPIERNEFLNILNIFLEEKGFESYNSPNKLTREIDKLPKEYQEYFSPQRLQKDNKKIIRFNISFNKIAISKFALKIQEENLKDIKINKYLKEDNSDEETKIKDIIARIIEIFNNNDNKFLFKNNIIQVLEVEYKKEVINIALKRLHDKNRFETSSRGIRLKS